MVINKIQLPESFLVKGLHITTFVLIITISIFASFLIKDIFLAPSSNGDEGKYISDLLKANEYGLIRAINDGASITYLVISFFLDKLIVNPLLSLKLTSLLSGILMFIILIIFNSKIIKLKSPIKVPIFLWIIYLFIIQTTIFSGINDILLDFFGTILLVVFFIKFKKTFIKVSFIGIILALMLGTRKMAFTYIFVLFFISFFLWFFLKNPNVFNFKNGIGILISFGAFFMLLNVFPLIKNNQFSFDDKILSTNVNWAQWDYHNAILIDEGVQERFRHIDIKETEKYLASNGENSLPSNFWEMIFFNPVLTLKEFFIDITTGLKYIFRQTGFLTIGFLFFLIRRLNKVRSLKTLTSTDFIYLFSISYFLIICFIVITNIQTRWFMLFMPITMILIGKDLNNFSYRNQMLFAVLNNIILTVMCIPYLLEKTMLFY